MTESNYIVFSGTPKEIIKQLTRYMDEQEATLYFKTFFRTPPNCGRRRKISHVILKSKARRSAMYRLTTDFSKSLVACRSTSTSAHKTSSKSIKQLDFEEIEQSIIVTGPRTYSIKKIALTVFVASVIALDIALQCTLGSSCVGTVISGASFLVGTLSTLPESKIPAQCLLSLVKEFSHLPKFSSLSGEHCANIMLACKFRKDGLCTITKEVFSKTVNSLFKAKLLCFKE